MQKLPDTIDLIAWLDCDLIFTNPLWAQHAFFALQRWPVVQLFDYVHWLGPDGEPCNWDGTNSVAAGLVNWVGQNPQQSHDLRFGKPGYAWAARREVLMQCPPYDREIVGGGDTVFALGIYGWNDHAFMKWGSPKMNASCSRFIDQLHPLMDGGVGYLESPISHLWHGNRDDRAYMTRRLALQRMGFDPLNDVETVPSSGLLRWSKKADPKLKETVQNYFRNRSEDGAPT